MMVLKFSDVLIFKNCALLIFYLYEKINLKIIEHVIYLLPTKNSVVPKVKYMFFEIDTRC